MSIHRTPKSGLFLLEMVILILFFSVASAICVNLFVKAHVLSSQSRDLGTAVRQVQTAAEAYKAVDGDAARAAELLALTNENENYCAYYDSSWQRQDTAQDAAYTLVLNPEEKNEEGMVTARVSVTKNGDTDEEIFAVDVKKYIG